MYLCGFCVCCVCIYFLIYIYIYMCVCVCVCKLIYYECITYKYMINYVSFVLNHEMVVFYFIIIDNL